MIFVNHYVIWPPIPKTIFIKHCRVDIIAFLFVLFNKDRFLISAAFSVSDSLLHICSNSSSCHNLFVHTALLIRCDKLELTRWCLCSLHAGIQTSSDEVVGSRDGCRHSIAESTVDVPTRLFRQIFSARTSLFSCPFAQSAAYI